MIRIASREVKDRSLVLGLLGIALILRLWGLTGQAIWVDEVFTLKYAGMEQGMTWDRLRLNLQGPLHAFFVWLVSLPFGWGPAAIRLPEALLGAASVPVLYLVARRSFGNTAALAGALLLAVNPFHVWYSQEVRNYVLVILFAILGMGMIRRFTDGLPASRPRRALLLAATWVGGLLSNLSFAFHLVAAGIWAVVRLRRRRMDLVFLGVAGLATGLAMIPWLEGFYERRIARSHLLSLDPVPREERLRGDATAPLFGLPYAAYVFSTGYSLGPSLSDLRRSPSLDTLRGHEIAIGVTAACFGVLAVSGLIRWLRGDADRRLWLLCLLLPPLLALLAASRNLKVFNPRYAAVALPAYMMLLADGFGGARWRPAKNVCFAGVLGISLLSNIQLHSQPRYWKEDGGAASAVLKKEVRPGDLVFVIGGWDAIDHYYWREQRKDATFTRFFAPYRVPPEADGKVSEAALAAVDAARETYVLFFRDDFIDPGGAWERFLRERFDVAQTWSFTGGRIWKLGGRKP